ncbi:hypothetical protein A0H81_07377 [Grifola frondosa]|uniref:Uncharacterized protein n=1 Tax=Grifola frondosa TaxID=5627 RepID=A0A1C7M5B5_GRIFR|nr:hypothetical protein A0H81_07377 [Grifola frondosa]
MSHRDAASQLSVPRVWTPGPLYFRGTLEEARSEILTTRQPSPSRACLSHSLSDNYTVARSGAHLAHAAAHIQSRTQTFSITARGSDPRISLAEAH